MHSSVCVCVCVNTRVSIEFSEAFSRVKIKEADGLVRAAGGHV